MCALCLGTIGYILLGESVSGGVVSGGSSGGGSGRHGLKVVAVVLVLAGVVLGVAGLLLYLYYYYGVGGPYAPSGGGEYVVARVSRIIVAGVDARGYFRGLDYRVNVTVLLENLGDRGCYARVGMYCTCDGDTKWVYDYVYVPPRSYAYAYGDVDASIWAKCTCGAKVVDIDCP